MPISGLVRAADAGRPALSGAGGHDLDAAHRRRRPGAPRRRAGAGAGGPRAGDRPPCPRPLHQMARGPRRAARRLLRRPALRGRLMGGAARALARAGDARPRTGRSFPSARRRARPSSAGSTPSCITRTRTTSRNSAGRCWRRSPCGLPAVLPPVFRETFGAAALYAEPAEVWPTIAAALGRRGGLARPGAARGQDFVRASSDWSLFPARLKATLAEAHPPAAPDAGASPATARRKHSPRLTADP